jgi:hypothetical protein
MTRDRPLRLLKSALALALAATALFIALEMSARVYVFGPRGLDPRRVPIVGGLAPPGLTTRGSGDSYPKFRPNLDVFVQLVHFRTNSEGLRDKEYSREKPPGTFRVAVLGSSFTLPSGVEIGDAYHSLLEERLSSERAPTRFEFINFSFGAVGPAGVLERLHDQALAYDPDLILVGVTRAVVPYYLLEWEDSPSDLKRKYRWPPAGMLRHLAKRGAGGRSYFSRLLKSQWAVLTGNELPERQGIEPPATGRAPDDVVAKFARTGRETEIPVAFVRLEFDPLASDAVENRLAARIVAEGMHYLDTRGAFRGMTPRALWVHRFDPHPDARGHAIFASVIEDFLEENRLLGR